jgi:hypothetical protein
LKYYDVFIRQFTSSIFSCSENPRETEKIEKLFAKLTSSILLNLTEMSAAIELANCQLSLNKIIIDTLGGAMRNVLRTCAEKINDRFDELSTLDSDDRLDAIITMFGLNEEDIVKIKMPVKKIADPTKKNTTAKAKAEKKLPVPFWGKQTVKPELCQGLMAGLYNQCTGKPKNGGIYCAKCQKDADSNEGIPKRGNIECRMEQFRESLYEYTPPGGKLKKIYYYQYVLKNNFTAEDVDLMLKENGIKLNTQGKTNLIYIPEKKTRETKKKLTEDMEEKPKKSKKQNAPAPENDDEDDQDQNGDDTDFDDNASVCSQSTVATDQTDMTIGTQQTDFDDDGIPDAPDDDDDEPEPEPVKKPEPEPAKKSPKKDTIPDNVHTIAMKDVIIESAQKPKKSALKKTPQPQPDNDDDDEEQYGDEDQDQEIDITKYKIAKFGESRYAMLRDADMSGDVDIYDISDYVGPKNFKIVSFKPVGKFNKDTKKVKLIK